MEDVIDAIGLCERRVNLREAAIDFIQRIRFNLTCVRARYGVLAHA